MGDEDLDQLPPPAEPSKEEPVATIRRLPVSNGMPSAPPPSMLAQDVATRIPDKLFFTIGEVSGVTGVKPYILRYWESTFKFLRPQKNSGGQRIYRRRDVELILYIKQLLYEEKYTIEGAKQRLKEEKNSSKQLELFKEDPKVTSILRMKRQLESLLDYLSRSR